MSQLSGRIKVVSLTVPSGGAGTTYVAIRPPNEGVQWEIIWAIGQQNDGAVSHGWHWLDPENALGVELCAVVGAADVPLPLGALDSDLANVSMGPWWATYDRHPSYRFEASAAAKNGKITAIVIEYLGVEGAG